MSYRDPRIWGAHTWAVRAERDRRAQERRDLVRALLWACALGAGIALLFLFVTLL
jgi:hypothetical protein